MSAQEKSVLDRAPIHASDSLVGKASVVIQKGHSFSFIIFYFLTRSLLHEIPGVRLLTTSLAEFCNHKSAAFVFSLQPQNVSLCSQPKFFPHLDFITPWIYSTVHGSPWAACSIGYFWTTCAYSLMYKHLIQMILAKSKIRYGEVGRLFHSVWNSVVGWGSASSPTSGTVRYWLSSWVHTERNLCI